MSLVLAVRLLRPLPLALALFGADAEVVATGGLAGLIATEAESIRRVEAFLTLEGLRYIYERNREPG